MLGKKSVTLIGTSHDNEGTISINMECHGFEITKKTSYDNGNISLTPAELYALVHRLENEFPRTMDAGKNEFEQAPKLNP